MFFDPSGGKVKLTSAKVLALVSGRFTPCGAQRCGLHSYCSCAPLTHWLPPQPRTPVRTRLLARKECGLVKVVFTWSACRLTADANQRKAFRLFLRSGGTVQLIVQGSFAPFPSSNPGKKYRRLPCSRYGIFAVSLWRSSSIHLTPFSSEGKIWIFHR